MTLKIQISKRLDDGTIVVIGGETPDEFAAHATELVGSGAGDLIALFYELVPASAGSNPAPNVPTEDPQVAAAKAVLAAAGLKTEDVTPAPAASAGPACKHGPRIWKSDVNKQGKAYKMWKCPSKDRADECSPEWVR